MKKTFLLLAILGASGANYLSAQSLNPAPYCDASFDDDPLMFLMRSEQFLLAP